MFSNALAELPVPLKIHKRQQSEPVLLKAEQADFLASGKFSVGCNYWASHAGTQMWSDWRPEVIADDFAQLAKGKLTLLRVFPLWPDFQPLQRLALNYGDFHEYRLGEEPLPDTTLGQAGLDIVMIERFREMADEAQRQGLRIIVGLITGWMSGRLFTPPAFANCNVITDPEALRWQARFVRCFVEEFRYHPAIVAWDLGNECNVMGRATAAESWVWTHTLSASIRAADPTRSIVSGMHSLSADPREAWAMRDQGELTDILTTHPYPIWTPHCDLDPVITLRPQLHGTAECLLTEGIGGKPCFAEEMGSMGPFIVADELAHQFLRPALFSLWAHDCRAMLWWCAYDENHLTHAPYDWVPVELELGLHRHDRAAKPLAGVVEDFAHLVARLPFAELPPRITEAVCLVTADQDHWAVAQNTFAMAKLAGGDLTFQWCEDALRPADIYLLPSLALAKPIPLRRWRELLTRVKAGAVLYVSLDSAFIAEAEAAFGVRVLTRSRRASAGSCQFLENAESLPLAGAFHLSLQTTRAQVLAAEADGNPAFTCCDYGMGKVFLLTTPIESTISSVTGAYQTGPYAQAWRIYSHVFAAAASRRVWQKTNAFVLATEHPQDEDHRIVILVNHTQNSVVEPVCLAKGWSMARILHGSGSQEAGISMEAGDGAILQLDRDCA